MPTQREERVVLRGPSGDLEGPLEVVILDGEKGGA
jgi:hypothetical protein